MGATTNIEWTDASWNPIRGCTIVSAGCHNCYAMRVAARFSGEGQAYEGLAVMGNNGPRWTGSVRLVEKHLADPLRWKRPRMIFVNSMSDLFHESVPDEWIDRIFAVMALSPQHTFQILTKRPERMREYVTALLAGKRNITGAVLSLRPDWTLLGANDAVFVAFSVASKDNVVETCIWRDARPLPNVWLGISAEDQATADERIPLLLQTPAAVRWVSAEPLLGPIDIKRWTAAGKVGLGSCETCSGTGVKGFGAATHRCPQMCFRPWARFDPRISWLVVGGESGPGARPMHPQWARDLRDQCVAASVPYFFKQWGEWYPTTVQGEYGDENDWYKDHAVSLPLRVWGPDGWTDDGAVEGAWLARVGKNAAGRLLDGIEWSQYPEVHS